MSSLETDFNKPPYFDDYNEDKRFHRVLFRPSTAVQARELTQLQTITQNQIERFGNHIFKDGSIVDGVAITYYPNTHYISLSDRFSSNVELKPSDLDSSYVVTNSQDSNTAVRASIKIAKDGLTLTQPNTNRFYLDYFYTGTGPAGEDINRFSPGDTLYIYSPNQSRFGSLDANNLIDTITTLTSNSSFEADGDSYCIKVSDGIIFQKGFFSKVNPQTITIADFSANVTGYVVGFNTEEIIVNENQDTSLLDNALGYDNENAPGAHRLKLNPVLVSKTRTDAANNKNFFAIVEFDANEPTEQKDKPEYSQLETQIARRTYEESGDYVIKPFRVESRVNAANTETFFYEVSSGIASIRGFRVEKVGATKLQATKASTTDYVQNQILTGNYGNYVFVDELVGAFDTETLQEISIYDQPQNSISEYEGSTSAPSGSEVGKANVRAVVFETGEKGSASAKFLLYIFNVRMNSGKSFINDAKSFYVDGTFGKAKADIVLENDKAIIKESNSSRAYFNIGYQAVKRLTNNTGINDTFYTYNQIKSGTLAINGEITITIDTAASGAGEEKILSTTEDDYQVFVSANAYTANLSGTIEFTSGNVVIIGTSTTFASDFNIGDNIRIYSNTTTSHVRQVVTVSNNTSLSLDAPITASNTSTTYGKYFVTGTALPVDNVTLNTNTNFTIDTGLTIDSGTQTVYCSYPVVRNQAQAIPKVILKNRFVKIDCSNNAANSVGPWDLGVVDLHKIRNIYVGTTYSNTNPERANWFNLQDGQTDNEYGHAKIFVKPQYASNISGSTKMLIELDLFTANTSASVGFFSVESYPIDDVNVANTNAIQTSEIPYHNNIDLRTVVDFRPRKYNTASTAATSEASATINPSVANSSYDVPAQGQHLIYPDKNFVADIEYYLPRIDLITVNPNGDLSVIEGIPSLNPRVPFVDNDQSAIAEAFVPPYPSATKREAETSINRIPYVSTNIVTNRRYTMKDIASLDERIQRIEYYTVLNALEQSARDLTIPDTNGLDRFKNGIFADPFNSHRIGNVADFEYKIAIDPKNSVARPFFQKHDVDFEYISANSSNVQRSGSLVTLPFDNEVYITQRFATKIRNTTESVWQWDGFLELYPNFDFFRDEDRAPNVVVNIDNTAPWEDFANSPFGTTWGDWENVGQERNRRIETAAGNFVETRQRQTREGTSLKIGSSTTSYNLGSYVTDFSINPYMRSRLVAFVANNMKPNTTLYPFFDDVNVSEFCAPGTLSGLTGTAEGREDRVVNRTGNFGDELVSDENGFVCGVFKIPEGTFRTGDRQFLLTNVSDLVIGESARITNGFATYTADNVSVTKGSTTINVIQPEINISTRNDSRVISSTSTETITRESDPIAQSFTVENLPDGISGIFVSQIGVYFQSKDPSLGCSVQICEMVNNLPEKKRIIGQGRLEPSSISVSEDGTAETVFELNYPVYLLTNTDYAFIVQPDGDSPEYNIWVGETGGYDVATGEQVFSNPYSGIMFISANKKTWTAIQKEDIKFNLYRSKFTASSGTAVFKNESDEFLVVDGFTRANTSVAIDIGNKVFTVDSGVDTGNVASVVSNTITSGVSGRVQYINEAEGEIWVDSSTANSSSYFSNTTNPVIAIYNLSDPSNNSLVSNSTLVAYGNIQEVKNLTYHSVVPKFGILQPTKTYLAYNYKGTSTTNVSDSSLVIVDNNKTYEYQDRERHIMSKSNEINDLSSNKSSEYNIQLNSFSDYSSPVINLNQKISLFIENLINNDSTNEHTRYGNALTKYVSKRIILKDGQEAEDLKVYLTAHRPFETDIEIYAKFINNEDNESFEDKVWTKLQYDNGGEFVYTSPDREDFVEYEFSVPSSNTVDRAAFANVTSGAYQTLTGTVEISNNSFEVTGNGTSFDTELTVGDLIRVTSDDYFAIRTVTSIANSTFLTVDNGLQASNSAAISYVFDDAGNEGIVEYYNADGSRYIGYKEVAFKIVLLSSNPVRIPLLQDIRAICLQI